MPDYREVPGDRDFEPYRVGWKTVLIEPVNLDARVAAIVTAHSEWIDIAAAQFVIYAEMAVSWYIRAGTLGETTFFADFFSYPTVRETLPILGQLCRSSDASDSSKLGFRHENSWFTTARLASYLTSGPISGSQGLPDSQVVPLVREFADGAFREAYSETLSHHSSHKWAEWFVGYRNSTSFVIDKTRGVITVIMITDAD